MRKTQSRGVVCFLVWSFWSYLEKWNPSEGEGNLQKCSLEEGASLSKPKIKSKSWNLNWKFTTSYWNHSRVCGPDKICLNIWKNNPKFWNPIFQKDATKIEFYQKCGGEPADEIRTHFTSGAKSASVPWPTAPREQWRQHRGLMNLRD